MAGLLLLLASASAQGSISGTIYAEEVRGYRVIACLPHAVDGCDEALSGAYEVRSPGAAAPFEIAGLPGGQYLLIAWRDDNLNGLIDEVELFVLVDAAGEPLTLSPPTVGVEFRLPGAAGLAEAPATAPAHTPASPPATPAAVPAELAGIWQTTRASANDYRTGYTGNDFTATSGYSVQLVIHPSGSYDFAHYTSGVESDCTASYLEQHQGTATLSANRLVLQPTTHRLDVENCSPPASRDLGTDPVTFTLAYSEKFDHNGHRSITIDLTGGPYPLSLELLHRDPPIAGYQPPQPADFVVGEYVAFEEFLGLWAPYAEARLDFYDPGTGAFVIPEFDGTSPEYLRIGADGYELARVWRDYNFEGVCSKDYVYYERGATSFEITEAASFEGGPVIGHARFRAAEVHLVVNIHDCGELSQALSYRLEPKTSYYEWRYGPPFQGSAASYPESFSLSCNWELSEWQFMVCDDWNRSETYYRRE